MRRFIGFVACFFAMILTMPIVNAQDATPEAELVTPDPAECRVEPRTMEELRAFVIEDDASPEASSPIVATPEPFVVPKGEPADDAVVAEVTATVHEWYACLNANAGLQMFALYSDDYLARSFAAEGLTQYAVDLLGTPLDPAPEAEWMSVGVRDIQVLDDGRIGAYIIGHSPFGDGNLSESYVIFVEHGGRYLVDEMIFLPGKGQ